MIKVVLVQLDGEDQPDSLRLAAANELAVLFEARIVALYVNVLPTR